RRRPSGTLLGEIAAVGVVVALVAGYVWVLPAVTGSGTPSPSPSASPPAVAAGSTSPSAASSSASPGASGAPSQPGPQPTSTTLPGGAIGAAGGVVVLGNGGSLAVIDGKSSRETVLATACDGGFRFPACTPAGTR